MESSCVQPLELDGGEEQPISQPQNQQPSQQPQHQPGPQPEAPHAQQLVLGSHEQRRHQRLSQQSPSRQLPPSPREAPPRQEAPQEAQQGQQEALQQPEPPLAPLQQLVLRPLAVREMPN